MITGPNPPRRPGRPSLLTPNVEWKLQIPVDLAEVIEAICFDPVRNKAAFGARSAYLTRLIRADLISRGLISAESNGNQGENKDLTTSTQPDTLNIRDGL